MALAGAALASAGAASAADLIVLAPDKAVISGGVTYTHVYVGNGATLQLAGDTLINAADVYIAGGATITTCFTPPASNTCTVGRNLAIQSSGQITIGTSIDLQGGAGAPRPGGTLALTGTSISISGGINTSGSMGGASGSVAIASSGSVSLSSPFYAASVMAPGAPVSIHGASVSLSGDVNTAGSDATIPTAGPVDLEATTGALSVFGNVLASGRDGSGGYGATVTLRGSAIRSGQIDTSGGSGSAGPPGGSAPIDVVGSASVTISGMADARGASGPAGYGATPGSNIRIASPGPVVTGAIAAQGADGNSSGPSAGGSILIQGAGVATGALYTYGGSRTTTAGQGAAGNNIVVGSTGAVSIGDAEAFGGASVGDGFPGGPGGSIAINGLGVITSELRTNPGISGGNSPGGTAGNITVTGTTFVGALGGVYAYGGAAGPAAAPNSGGPGGAVALHATAGQLSLPGPVDSGGGNGGGAPAGVKAGAGGAGGPVDLVGTPIDPIAGISTEGGNGGNGASNDLKGVGGNGGSLHAWSETNLYQGLRAVSTAGGSGAPPGIDGVQLLDSGPTGLSVDANGLLSWSSQSPYADGFNVYRSVAGAPATLALSTRLMSRIADPVAQPLCVPIAYAVAAYKTAVGWTSPTTPVATYTKQPSATQKCTDAATLSHSSKPVLLKVAGIKKNKGFSFLVTTNGMGALTATATTKGQKKPISSAAVAAAKAGTVRVNLKLNPKLKLQYKTVKKRQVAKITVKLTAAAPTGAAKSTITVAVEVRK